MYNIQILFTLIPILMLQIFSFAVSAARYKYGVKAPNTTGSIEFERFSRTHLNHLENMVMFIPLVWTAGIKFSSNPYFILICSVWVIARLLFSFGYINDLPANFKLITNTIAVTASVMLIVLTAISLF